MSKEAVAAGETPLGLCHPQAALSGPLPHLLCGATSLYRLVGSVYGSYEVLFMPTRGMHMHVCFHVCVCWSSCTCCAGLHGHVSVCTCVCDVTMCIWGSPHVYEHVCVHTHAHERVFTWPPVVLCPLEGRGSDSTDEVVVLPQDRLGPAGSDNLMSLFLLTGGRCYIIVSVSFIYILPYSPLVWCQHFAKR